MFKLGVITDEVSQHLEEAAVFARKNGLTVLELRSVENKGPFQWNEADAECFLAIINKYNLQIAAISAPLFKCDFQDDQTILDHIEGFRRCAGYCKMWGCKLIRGFDFWESGRSVQERAEKFKPIIEICEEYGIVCALEYDPSVHASTPAKIKEIVEYINNPCIRALFDPGNGLFSTPGSHPFPDDYQLLKPLFSHIHMKDAICLPEGTKSVCIGKGQVNYPALLQALKDEHYEGCLMLETHYRLNAELTEEQLKQPGGHLFSDGAYAASQESMEAFHEIMRQLK